MHTSVLDQLRAATRPLHARLEAVVGLMHPGLDAGGYRRYLARSWAFHAPLEDALATAPAVPGLAPGQLARAHLLARDLDALGLGEAERARLPRCERLPALDRAGHVLGLAYVVEGSALGGAFLHRHLTATIPEAAARASASLRPHGDGKATGQRWREFVALLEAAGPGLGAQDVVAGAVGTFAALEAWFTRGAPR